MVKMNCGGMGALFCHGQSRVIHEAATASW
jgi:hypothetical protein